LGRKTGFKHFIAVSSSEEFSSLDFNTVLQLLREDNLHVDSEEQVFEAAIRWVEADLPNRGGFVPRLLTAIRMPLLKPCYLMDLMSNPIIHNSIECRDLVDEAKNYHLIPGKYLIGRIGLSEGKNLERRAAFNSFTTVARHCSDVPGIIYAVGGLNNPNIRRPPYATSAVEMFDPLVGKW